MYRIVNITLSNLSLCVIFLSLHKNKNKTTIINENLLVACLLLFFQKILRAKMYVLTDKMFLKNNGFMNFMISSSLSDIKTIDNVQELNELKDQ